MIVLFRVRNTYQIFFRKLKPMRHEIFEPAPKFKYGTLLSCKKRNIFSIYIRATARFIRENDCDVQGSNPKSNFIFENWPQRYTKNLDISKKFKYITLLCYPKNIDIISIYGATKARSVHKNDQHVQCWNPTTSFFENWTQWCMIDSRLTPHFKYSTMRCFQNRDIFSIYRPTRSRSLHENDQHVQGWKLNTNLSKITKIQTKQKTGNRKNDLYIF